MFLAGFPRMKLRAMTAILVVSGAIAGAAAIGPQSPRAQEKPATSRKAGEKHCKAKT